MPQKHVEQSVQLTIHLLCWAYFFMAPWMFKKNDISFEWHRLLQPFVLCMFFYFNYFLLVPRFVLRRHKIKWFILLNTPIALFLMLVIEAHVQLVPPSDIPHKVPLVSDAGFWHFHPSQPGPPRVFFVLRTLLSLVLCVVAAVVVRLSMQWRQSEEGRRQAELGRSQAELQNIKNQINPHFLLNTLNNIYALTAFDTDKAQQAIQELSHMLHYVLYENQSDRVSLKREVDFISCYIELMRLRMAQQVEVKVNMDVPQNEEVQVAPLIFISLVENAFKHGVSPTQPSYIHIDLKATARHLRFSCENTNFPQPHREGTPGGIGFKQVVSRLEMSYPGRHTWQHGPSADGTVYHAEINVWDKVRS